MLQEGSTRMGPFRGEDDQWLVASGRYKEVCTSITSLPRSSFVSHPLKLTFVFLSCFPDSPHSMDAPPGSRPSAYWLEHPAWIGELLPMHIPPRFDHRFTQMAHVTLPTSISPLTRSMPTVLMPAMRLFPPNKSSRPRYHLLPQYHLLLR